MTWIQFALALVKLANIIFNSVRDKALIRVGEDRAALRAFQAMQAVSQKLKEVEDEYSKKTNEEIKKDIEQKGDFRD